MEGSNIPVDTKNTISKQIQTGIGINLAISIKLVITLIFTFLGPDPEVLKETLAKEQLKQQLNKSTVQLIPVQSARNAQHPVQLIPVVQCQSWSPRQALAVTTPSYRSPVYQTVSGAGQTVPIIVSRQTIN